MGLVFGRECGVETITENVSYKYSLIMTGDVRWCRPTDIVDPILSIKVWISNMLESHVGNWNVDQSFWGKKLLISEWEIKRLDKIGKKDIHKIEKKKIILENLTHL